MSVPCSIPKPRRAKSWHRRCYMAFGKRLFDLVITIPAIIILLPLFLVLAILIRVDTPGPVIYTSRRVGEGGRIFNFFKFRSMVVGAEGYRDRLQELNEVDGPVFKIANDPRTTRFGRFLRRTSLDELPQMFNVLLGDMTLVGPRPPIPDEVVQYLPWQRARLSVRPGITCLWQISGRSQLGFDEWMRLDLKYVEGISLGLDIKILLQTIPAVLSREGAY
ncbi:MAG: sugar transferase [Candidatus Eisenbacteria bacterium]|nr:sugar transferase [Candidatus Eisenbacteria bacterium]MBU1950542.1 sugar transferase [Candidatus Eisenbacteria bacterium]